MQNLPAHPFIDSIFVGQPRSIEDQRGTWISSIYRERVGGSIKLSQHGLAGDRVAQPYHGGPDGAVCVHLCDHYRFWNSQYRMNLQPGNVGENLTLDDLTENEVCAGDIVRLGTALIQVSGPRVPCANLARRIGRPDWVKLTIQENRTGFYLRVLEPGTIRPGDHWLLQERPNPDGSIEAINRCIYLAFDQEFAIRVTKMIGLADWWGEQFRERLERCADHWTVAMSN